MERMTERKGLCVKTKYVGDFGFQNVLHRLAEYEDAEEQGVLVRLPCKIGDELYWISDEDEDGRRGLTVCKYRNAIQRICIAKEGVYVTTDEAEEYCDKLGTRYAYLTREEAEEELKAMNEKEN